MTDRSSFPSRILAVCGGFVTIGGAERMVFEALELFHRRGSAVHCVVNDWENDAVVAEAQRIGITWTEGKYSHRLRWRNQSAITTARGALATMETSAHLMKEVSRFNPTAVLVPDYETVLRNAAALALIRAKGIPVVLHLHNSPPPGAVYANLFRWVINPVVSRYAVVSQHMEGELIALGIPKAKIRYVNNFIPDRPSNGDASARDPRRVIFAGQMIPQKGLDVLLEAFAIVAAKDETVHLDVASKMDGWISPAYADYRSAVLARAERADLHGRVSMLGWRPDVPDLLRRAGIHCAASRPEMYEGMPLVCLEAKQAGTPSVVPDAGAFTDLVTHRVDGYVCRDLSPESIAEGLRYFLDNTELASRAGEKARQSLSRFSRSEFDRRWEDLFAGLQRAT